MKTEKSTNSVDFKAVMTQSAKVGANIGGFATGHVLYGVVPAKFKTGMIGILASIAMVAIGAFVALKSEKEHIQQASIGFAAYGGVKALNLLTGQIGAIPSTAGLGKLPEGMANIMQKIIPTLGESSFSFNGLGNAEDTTETIDIEYELLPANPNERVEEKPFNGDDIFIEGLAPEIDIAGIAFS